MIPLPPLSTARAFLLDGDGVLYRGAEPLPGARAFIDALNARGTPYLLLTNNATRTPQQLAAKMLPMRIAIDAGHIFTAAQATTLWLQARYPAGAAVLAVGEDGLRVALSEGGFRLVEDCQQAELVVAGLDRTITYARLAEAALAIGRGCPFIATNPDKSIPTERGIEPGAGALIAFLHAVTGVTPPMIGKPEAAFFHQAMSSLGVQPEETVMVGDRYETDILGAHNAGIRSAAVLTGISRAAEFAAAEPPPTWVFEDLTSLLPAWQG